MTTQPADAPLFNESFQLDSAEIGDRQVFVTPSGRMLRLSADVRQLLGWQEQGWSTAQMAEHLRSHHGRHVTSEQVEEALDQVLARVDAIEASADFQGLWLKWTIIPQRLVEPIAHRLAWLFHQVVAAGVLVISAIAVYWMMFRLPMPHPTADPTLALMGLLLANVSVLAHEFGHAAAAARFGIRPREIGLGIYLLFPVFYSNVNDAWRLKRQQRCIVDAGGLYFQLLVICLFALGFALTQSAMFYWAVLSVLFSFVTNLNPFFKFDGYWLLSDLLGVANLHGLTRDLLKMVVNGLRGLKPNRPLPFGRFRVVVVTLYSVFATAFWIYVAWNVVRFLMSLVTLIPQQWHALGVAWALSPVHVINALLPLAQALALFIAVIGFVATMLSRLFTIRWVKANNPASQQTQ